MKEISCNLKFVEAFRELFSDFLAPVSTVLFIDKANQVKMVIIVYEKNCAHFIKKSYVEGNHLPTIGMTSISRMDDILNSLSNGRNQLEIGSMQLNVPVGALDVSRFDPQHFLAFELCDSSTIFFQNAT